MRPANRPKLDDRLIAALAGVAGIVVPSAGLFILPIWRFPATSSPGTAIVAFAAEHRAGLQVVMACNALGVTLWLVFGAALWSSLRHATETDPGATGLLTCFGFASVSYTTLLLAGFVAFDVVVYRLPDPAGARLLYDLTFGLLAMSGLPTAVATGGYAVLQRRLRRAGQAALPAWNIWLAALTAIAHVALLISFIVPRGFFSLEGPVITVVPGLLWAWILVTAISLFRAPAQTPRTSAVSA